MLFFSFFGCIPIPLPRNVIVQPELHVQVLNEKQKYISNAQVVFVTLSDPHHNVHRYMTFDTDKKGKLYIPEQKEFEWIFPLMMHGIPFYSYHLCIYKDGYITQSMDVAKKDSQDQSLMITLFNREELNKQKKTLLDATIDPCAQYKFE